MDVSRDFKAGYSSLGRLGERLWAVAVALAGLGLGGSFALVNRGDIAAVVWSLATLPVLAALAVEIVTSLRRGMVGLDLVAALSMSAGLLLGEPLAANVVALMYAGGQLLERYAEGRARREMTALLGRVPRTALRLENGTLIEVPIDALVPGETILVRSGEAVPADGLVKSESALLDESALTGESLPIRRQAGEPVVSGSTNASNAFELVVSRPASASTYAQIVRRVREAEESKAPVERTADRLALGFLAVTLAIAAVGWGVSGDKIRALAVLVAATPCPLILALPVALISGMSRAAKHGILIKNGGALEALSGVRTVIVDKTGTLTFGVAEVVEIRTVSPWTENEILRLAASIDQASHHVIAEAIVREAKRRSLNLTTPVATHEEAGAGVTGRVDGTDIAVGSTNFVASQCEGDPRAMGDGIVPGMAIVAVAINGNFSGIIVLRDLLRPDAQEVLNGLRGTGITRIVMASGDRQAVVDAAARELPIDAAIGDLDPSQKVALVARESNAAPTLMVGDGVNDAPALATATIGAAMGARGAAASSETAGIVILVDRIDRVLKAVQIAAWTRHIATQSVIAGLVLSLACMVVAALGYLPPIFGALAQEVIDVAVILNALRALR